MTSRLLTPSLKKELKEFPLYSQDGKGVDAKCICVFYIGNIKWFVLEGQPEGNDFTFYSVVVGLCETEYGYASLKEMESIKIKTGNSQVPFLSIQQDMNFKPTELGNIRDPRLQAFLAREYK